MQVLLNWLAHSTNPQHKDVASIVTYLVGTMTMLLHNCLMPDGDGKTALQAALAMARATHDYYPAREPWNSDATNSASTCLERLASKLCPRDEAPAFDPTQWVTNTDDRPRSSASSVPHGGGAEAASSGVTGSRGASTMVGEGTDTGM